MGNRREQCGSVHTQRQEKDTSAKTREQEDREGSFKNERGNY